MAYSLDKYLKRNTLEADEMVDFMAKELEKNIDKVLNKLSARLIPVEFRISPFDFSKKSRKIYNEESDYKQIIDQVESKVNKVYVDAGWSRISVRPVVYRDGYFDSVEVKMEANTWSLVNKYLSLTPDLSLLF